jgi:N-formylglutamate amidohydrolase
MTCTLPYISLGPSEPRSAVVISVPHAGRAYPEAMASLTRIAITDIVALEDRFADKLADVAIANGVSAIVATTPRAWIDLNRAEREYDPGLVDGARLGPPVASAKVRGGLGIIPRRIARGGDIWKGVISADAFAARLENHYRPYHAALSDMIEARLARFGVAIVLDLHSMPPLPPLAGGKTPQVIIGDSFGRSASNRFSHCATRTVAALAMRVSTNIPYAGGHILERHGKPARGVHALQVEIDRSLYLDVALDRPGDGLVAMQQLINNIVLSLAQESEMVPFMHAAE